MFVRPSVRPSLTIKQCIWRIRLVGIDVVVVGFDVVGFDVVVVILTNFILLDIFFGHFGYWTWQFWTFLSCDIIERDIKGWTFSS